MTEDTQEILARLKKMQGQIEAVRQEAADKGHFFIWLCLIAILIHGCK